MISFQLRELLFFVENGQPCDNKKIKDGFPIPKKFVWDRTKNIGNK